MYEHSHFEKDGIKVIDMEFPDGSNPSDNLIVQFIELCEYELNKRKAITVHCRAGLGRTGTLIGFYIMYKYKWSAKKTIAWMRLCRPGSVVGEQQQFMEDFEPELQRMVNNHKGSFKHNRECVNPEPSPERQSRAEVMCTPTKAKKRAFDYSCSCSSSKSSERKEEIDGNSYIKQYYLKKYGSAKKGFCP